MPEYPPFITDAQDRLVVANGTDDDRAIIINKGESVFLSCPKENFVNHPSDARLEMRQTLTTVWPWIGFTIYHCRCDSDSGSTFTVIKYDSEEAASFSSLGC